MISEILKSNNPEVYEMIQKNNSAKSLVKQMESLWKRIEVMLAKDLKQIMKGKIK